MLNQTDSGQGDTGLRFKPLSLDEVWNRVDPLGEDLRIDPAQIGLAGLPYFKLGGPGLERLIYELLQAENQRPWFFGRAGQAQYGIDIVTEVAGHQDIYQCKNHAGVPSWPQVRDAVGKFESEWLNDMNLPAPREFVYCCPQPLNDNSFLVEWERFKDAFQKRTGVALSFWDRHAIDSRLSRLPDLVAGLFSDSYAEHFCGRDDWRDDPWTRVQRGPARFLGINRFLERHDRKAIYVAESHEQFFGAALDQGSVVALRGLPGMGKTFLALELACRLRQPIRRIYYATLKDGASTERLWQSAIRRLSLPSLFVLDDCHLAPEVTSSLLDRLGPELRSGKLKLVVLLRDQVGTVPDQLDDSLVWLTRLKQEQAVIDLTADAKRTLAVVCHLRPDFTGLSRARMELLHNTCGGDLLLLDEILQTLMAPQDIEILEVNKVLANVRTHYFGGNLSLPTLAKLAALAQFDLLPRADFFLGQWRPDEEKSAEPLMTRLFAPPRYQFLHSSLAALVLRALAQLDVGEGALDERVASITSTALRDYLLYLNTLSESSGEFASSIQQFLRAKQPLGGKLTEARMRSDVLGDKAIDSAIEGALAKQSFTNLGLCVGWLSATEHPAKAHYIELIEQRFRILFERANAGGDTVGMNSVSIGLLVLRRHAPDRWSAVLNDHGVDSFLRLILANGTLFELFMLLQNATPGFRTALLGQLTAEQAEALLNTTIATRHSIGTLHLAMRELGKDDPDLLTRLERAIGAAGFLRLILANGTLFELFSVLRYATSKFRATLLEQLTPERAEALLNKTIAAGRSIGTLNLAMRELGKEDADLLIRLERAIGAPGFLRLILTNGTLFELFGVLKHATSGFRTALVEQLTSEQAEALLDKTIASGRSIGTLALTMRGLGEADPDLLVRLEGVIDAPGFVRLILANGTLFELFKVLESATSGFRTALLEQLTSEQAEALLDKTIAAGRSVGTLHLAMRGLGKDDPEHLTRLERAISAPGFLRLILANGTLYELFSVLKNATREFRTALLEHLTPNQAATLLRKFVAADLHGIENIHFLVRSIATGSTQPSRLEAVLGVQGWWRLLITAGSLNGVSGIIQSMSGNFRAQMISGATELSESDWRGIIARGMFLNACAFATNDLPSYPAVARTVFRAALKKAATPLAARASWLDLNLSRPPVEPENAEGVVLRAAFRARVRALQLTELFGLEFREAVNSLACCWRERPDLRSELGKNLRKIMPSRDIWPREKGEVATLRLVLALARNAELPEEEARWLLAEATAFLDREVCADIDTLPLFLLAWNIAALSYERGPERDFAAPFSYTAQELLVDVLADRVHPKGPNAEKLVQFALAGLLHFLLPQRKRRLVEVVAPLKSTVRWLVPLAMDQSFVPAVFGLEGIALLAGRERIFTPAICEELLPKFEEYEEVGPALENLRLRVSGGKPSIRRP